MDLDADEVLYQRMMLDSEGNRRTHNDGLCLEEGSVNNTATWEHSCDWCIANLGRESQPRFNMSLRSAMVGNEMAAVIVPK